ncbi:HalOD1 output domain-containing protein [Halomarina litorea]|uniref:HalOD1 output domain-containing protein n=1 Tax=Halomarina litorea TaxID=2961595 RepID=UPI0020C3E4CB|nr:HalOD1 output domain-containing protein [Halomarina sp. BCD28]
MTHDSYDSFRFDETTGTYRSEYDASSTADAERVLLGIASAVAKIRGVPVTESTSLSDVVAVERVAHLIADRQDRPESPVVTFTYEESRVTITDGEVVIRPPSET